MLIKPSKKSLESIKRTIKSTVLGQGRALTQDQLIGLLNPKLRGWCNYHSSSVASKTFGYLDAYLFQTLFKWALHRHNDKSKQWVLERYWHRKGNRQYEFFTDENQLFRPCDVKIRRHIKVKGRTNPYIDIEYYVKRKSKHKFERGFRDKSFTS
ncbi:MAG: hypothetical protein MJZ68_01480 [archaeon]|nr:hypothetical protein [archaeon]